MNFSGQNFYSNKQLKNTPSVYENKRIHTPLSYNTFGLSDILQSENSIMFNPN